MGRFYQTAQPEFIQDFVYQPPWELLDKAMATQQAGYDNTMGQASLLDNLDIKYINSDEERRNVQEIQQYYSDNMNSIVNNMQGDAANWKKYQGDIRKLQKELQMDMQSGAISKIQGNYGKYQQYQKDMEKLRLEAPDRYNAALKHGFKNWGGNSLTGGVWSQEDIIKDPNFQERLSQAMKDLKANTHGQVVKKPGGGYMINNELEVEELESPRVLSYLMNSVLADPQTKAWMKQSQDWGLGNYFDADTGKMIPLTVPEQYMDEAGKIHTREALNPESGFYNFLSAGQNLGYRSEKTKQEYSTDTTQQNALDRKHAFDLAKYKDDLQGAADNRKFMQKVKLDALDGHVGSQRLLDDLQAAEYAEVVNHPLLTLEQNLKDYLVGDPIAQDRERDATDYVMNKMESTEDQEFVTYINTFLSSKESETKSIEEASAEYASMKMNELLDERHSSLESILPGYNQASQRIAQTGSSENNSILGFKGVQQSQLNDTVSSNRVKEENRIYNDYEKIAKNVLKHKEAYFKDKASKQQSTEIFVPLTETSRQQFAVQANAAPEAFWVVAPNGTKVDFKNTAKEVVDIGNVNIGSMNSKIGTKATVKDSKGRIKEVTLFLKDNAPGQQVDRVIRSSLLNGGFLNKGSEAERMLLNDEASKISTRLNAATPHEKTNMQSIVVHDRNGNELRAVKQGNQLFIMDTQTETLKPVGTYLDIVKALN